MSINKITCLDQFHPNTFSVFTNPSHYMLETLSLSEFKDFIDSLEAEKAYVATFYFLTSWYTYDEDDPGISLTKPIIITKNSNPILISNLISNRIGVIISNYYFDDGILDNLGKPEGPGVIIKYIEINIF